MKIKSYFVLLSLLIFLSCTKEDELIHTSFQLKTTNYLTGEGIGDLKFYLNVGSSSCTFKVNSYGNFDTILTHADYTGISVAMDKSNLLQVNTNSSIQKGEHNVLSFEAIPCAILIYHFDCTAPGSYKCGSVNHEMLDLPQVDEPHFGSPQCDFNGDAFTDCGEDSYPMGVFATDYIVSYKLAPLGTYDWVEYHDTITLQPGEEFIYTIAY